MSPVNGDQCLIRKEMKVLEVKMVECECIFCGSMIAVGRFVVPGAWICGSCITRLEEPLDWDMVDCRV
jgi:ribosomal protein L37AE/L43A